MYLCTPMNRPPNPLTSPSRVIHQCVCIGHDHGSYTLYSFWSWVPYLRRCLYFKEERSPSRTMNSGCIAAVHTESRGLAYFCELDRMYLTCTRRLGSVLQLKGLTQRYQDLRWPDLVCLLSSHSSMPQPRWFTARCQILCLQGYRNWLVSLTPFARRCKPLDILDGPTLNVICL